jgi:hypothetical protein
VTRGVSVKKRKNYPLLQPLFFQNIVAKLLLYRSVVMLAAGIFLSKKKVSLFKIFESEILKDFLILPKMIAGLWYFLSPGNQGSIYLLDFSVENISTS